MARQWLGGGRNYQRWLKEHPKLQLCLSKDEYEFLRGLANDKEVSMKDVVLEVQKWAVVREFGALVGRAEAQRCSPLLP